MGFRRYISGPCVCVGFVIYIINYNHEGTFLIIPPCRIVQIFVITNKQIWFYQRQESEQDSFSNIRA